MNEREFEEMFAKLMKQDFSVGTEKFREELLQRCLQILDQDEGVELDDSELEMLAAAGDPTGFVFGENGGIGDD